MSSETTRIQFRAPEKMIARVDALATVLDEDRSEILVTAFREYLRIAASDETLAQEIAGAYYDDEITIDQLETLVGPEEAANLGVLKQQLDEDFIDDLADLE